MKNLKQFSKKMLALDYIIAVILIVLFCVCQGINGIYTMRTLNQLVQMGVDVSMITITSPFNLDVFGVMLGAWITQLALSSGAYYYVIRSDHQIELPMQLVNSMPKEIQEQVDMTTVITTVLGTTNN